MYLQVPEGLPNRVRELTLQITADARTPYEKMRSLEDYLKTNFTYTNTPDITKRKSADFVDAFLFEVMEGYCDYYSSALAVMGRVIGVPTRWVKGYAPGVLPLDQMMYQQPFTVDPTGSGTYTVRNADAHSWVEAYFQGYGWIPFEPTAGFTFPYAQAESDTQQQLDIPETTPDVETVQLEEETANSNWVGYTGLAILAGLAVFAIYRRRQIIDSLIRYRFRRFTPSQRIAWETERLLRYGKRKGLPFSEHDTARESLSAWIDRRALLEQELTEVLRQFEQAKYSGIPASEGEMKQFIALIKTVRERI
nr:transglutaminase domain-containing protein [Paenibacillus roseus]